jgi:hypothetical protein
LEHDGVPWNNNNAEHAIKRFAKYRRDADGRFTERTLEEYLILATVFETCAFNNLNVLKFMLSKETTLDGLFAMAGRKLDRRSASSSGSEGCSEFERPFDGKAAVETQLAAGGPTSAPDRPLLPAPVK